MTAAPGRRGAPGPFLVAVATALVHAAALGGDFLDWDDEAMFLDHAAWRGLAPANLAWMFGTIHMAHYMPVAWLTCGLDWVLWGLDPRGYHLTSVLFHAAGAAVWHAVIRRLLVTGAPGLRARVASGCAAAGALAWSLGPLRVESVAWITERRGVVSGLLAALTVLCWLRALDGGPRAARRRAWSLAFFALALLAKTSAMTLPAALLVLDAFPLRRLDRGWRALVAEKRELLVLAALGAFVAWLGQARTPEALTGWDVLGAGQRVAIAGYAWAFYAWKTLLPLGLSPLVPLDARLAPTDAPFVTAWAAALAVTAALVALRRRWPAGLAAWAAYTVLVAPVLGLSHAGWHLVADRYAYLPGVALGALFAAACAGLARAGLGRVAGAAAAIALVASAALTVRQTGFWSDSVTLWTRVAERAPDRSVGHHRLGVALLRAGEAARAVEALERAAAAARDARELDPRHDLARARLLAGDPAGADEALAALLAVHPAHPGALLLREALLVRAGRLDEAARTYDRAAAADPSFAPARDRAAALRAEPPRTVDHVAAQLRAARELLAEAHPVSAEYHARNALVLAPDDDDARALLRACRAAQGRAYSGDR